MFTRRDFLKTAAGATAFGAGVGAANLAKAEAPFQPFQAPGFYRIAFGGFEITALSDGTIPLDLTDLYTNTTPEAAQAALKAAFQATPTPTSVNAYLINTGDRLVLVDAGTGSYLGPDLGRLSANMAAAGYEPADVDDVILTHVHTDHSGGLSAGGERLFPRATLRVNARELQFWLDTALADRPPTVPPHLFAEATDSLGPYIKAGKLQTFSDDAEVLPGFGSILRAGHTPGHSSIVVTDGDQMLVIWGDITHGDVLQFDKPGVAIEFDVDQEAAIRTRAVAFEEAAREMYLVAGAHLAFPGLGYVRRDATNFDWVPVTYTNR
jgi:glyoxylase-like metal-dependent hydrolase (beta-lactamase superfamily II)